MRYRTHARLRRLSDASRYALFCAPAMLFLAPRYASLRGGSIRGLFANDIAGKASSVFKMTASFWGECAVL